MNHRSLALYPAALCLLVLFHCSCNSAHNETGKAPGSKPNPYDDAPPVISRAKVTGTTMLSNVVEIGLFDGAGRVTCLVIDKADSNHLVAGAATGGLWSTHDRGRTWAPIDDHLPTLSIRSITQNPLQTNTYYACTNTTMVTAAGSGIARPDIYKSSDGGQTFQLLPATAGTFNNVTRVVCSPLDVNTVYALSNKFLGGRGLYRSQNGGQSFTLVMPVANGEVNDLEVLPDGRVLVSVDDEVFRSPNGNSGTFTPSVSGLNGTNTFTYIDMAFSPSQPNRVYAITTGGNSGVGLFKSIDGGQNWTFQQSLVSGEFTRTLGVKPNNPDFYLAGSVGLYLTQNGGSTFNFYGAGGVDWWSVNFDPHNPDKLFLTFDQGIVEIGLNPFNPNANTAYKRRDSLLNCAQIYHGDYFVTGDRVIIGMQDMSTSVAYPGGEHGIGAGGDGAWCFFHKQDTTVAYASSQNGNIKRKTNVNIPFGQSGWTNPVSILNQLDADANGSVDEGAGFIHPFMMNNADGQQLYFPTYKRLWRSTNGGTNWQPISQYYNITSTLDLNIECNHKANPIVYWTIKDSLIVMVNAKTAAAGSEFRIKMPGKMRWLRRDPGNDSIVYVTAYVATTGDRIFRSSNIFNGNVQWTSLTGNLPDDLAIRCVEPNPDNKNQMVAGTSSGLYVTADGGQTWEQEMQFPNVNILRTSLRASDKRLFVYTYGRGAWAASFPAPGAVAGPVNGIADLKIWPNPSQGIVHIGIGTVTPNTLLIITSFDGRVHQRIQNLQHTPFALNLEAFPAGTYIVSQYEGSVKVAAGKVQHLQ